MSRWDRRGWYTPAPKKPPPARGIKMRKSGSTWWGQRWVEALEHMSAEYSNRLSRGRTYARAGRTHDLVINPGVVTAKVTGSRAKPYKVTIALAKLSDAVWSKAIAAMAEKAQFSAELLAGEMPQEIDTAFRAAGGSVFPEKEADLETDCSCPDWANPCKHVAATHYVLGEALDRDPFLLFELRGRTKKQVLESLRAARAGEGGGRAKGKARARRSAPSAEVPAVSFGKLKPGDYDRPREPLPTLHLSFEPPPISGSVLRQLGTPAGWRSDASPAEVLGPMIRAAAEMARAVAMAEPAPDPPAEASVERGPSPERKPRKRAAGSKKTARRKKATPGTRTTRATPGSKARVAQSAPESASASSNRGDKP